MTLEFTSPVFQKLCFEMKFSHLAYGISICLSFFPKFGILNIVLGYVNYIRQEKNGKKLQNQIYIHDKVGSLPRLSNMFSQYC